MGAQLAVLGGKPVRETPFHSWPVYGREEEEALRRVLHSGHWWRYDRPPEQDGQSENVQFQQAFAAMTGAAHAIAVANGTAALEIILRATGIGPGDEVIVPAYTFVASATSILQVGGRPVFIDVEQNTMNLNPDHLNALITKNTKAVMVVHFAGQSVDFDRILPIAQQHGLPVIEDAAHAHGSRWRGRGLGSIGIAAGFSFQGSKNMTAGEGGMITTNDERIARLCESYYSLGREAGRPWYEFHRLGWNYRMSEFQAALLRAQLGRLHQQNARRMVNARILDERLSQIPGIIPVERIAGADAHSYHIYMFRYERDVWDGLPRQKFIEAVKAEGIPVDFGYAFPLFENPLFLEKNFHANGWNSDPTDYRSYQATCPVSRRLCYDEAVWIPHSTLLGSADDMQDICTAVEKVREHRGRLM